MKTMMYKGFEIQAKPNRLENKQWTINIDIKLITPTGVNNKNFSALTTFSTEEEAIKHCFNFGRQIIDGEVPNCTVTDL